MKYSSRCLVGRSLLAMFCVAMFSCLCWAETVTVNGLTNQSYDSKDIVINLASAVTHSGTISGSSSITLNCSSLTRQTMSGSYSFTGPINVNGGGMLFTSKVTSPITISVGGAGVNAQLYALASNIFASGTTINIKEGGMVSSEGGTNAIQYTTVNVSNGGTMKFDESCADVKITMEGTGSQGYGGALYVYHSSKTDVYISGTIDLTGDATIVNRHNNNGYVFGINSNISGSDTLTVRGDQAGNWTIIQGDNSGFTGDLIIDKTKARISSGGIGNAKSITAKNSATLIAWSNTVTFPNVSGTSSTLDINGKSLTLNNTKDTTFQGTVSGSGTLIKDGTGTMTLSSTSKNGLSYSAATKINAGTLVLNTTAYQTINSNFSGSGTLKLSGNKTSDSHFDFTNRDCSSFTGNLIIDGARMCVNGTSDFGTTSTNIDIKSGGQMYIAGGSVEGNFTIAGNGTSEDAGLLGAIRVDSCTLSGSIKLSDDAKIFDYGGNSNINATIDLAGHTLTFGAYKQLNPCGVISDSSSAKTGSVIYDSTAHLDIKGSNTYSGTTTLKKGTLYAYNANAYGNSKVILEGGTFSQVGQFTFKNDIEIKGTTTINTNGNRNMYLNGKLSGTGTVTRAGGWTLFLHGDNSAFAGTFNAYESNTYFQTVNSGSAKAKWYIRGTLASTAGSGTIELGEISGTGVLRNDVNGHLIYKIGALNTSSTFSGQIRDNSSSSYNSTQSVKIHKVGTGTLTLSGTSNYYTDGTIIENGTIVASAKDSLGKGNISIGKDGTLKITSNAQQTLQTITGYNSTSGTVELTFGSSGSWTAVPINGFTGTIKLNTTVSTGNKLYVNSSTYEGVTVEIGNGTTMYFEFNEFKGDAYLYGTGNNEGYGAYRMGNNSSGNIFVMTDSVLHSQGKTHSGTITAGAESGEVTLTFQNNGTISGSISDGDAGSTLGVIIRGPYTFSGELEYTGKTTINSGATLNLSGEKATLANSSTTTVNGTLNITNYTGTDAVQVNNLTGSGKITGTDSNLTVNNVLPSLYTGSIDLGSGTLTKTGNENLKLNTATKDSFKVGTFVMNDGRVDIQKYFTGDLSVQSGATLSPGNSAGTLTVTGNVNIGNGGTLLFEQDATGMDQLILETGNSLTLDKSAILELTMGQAISGATYTIIENGTDFTGDQATSAYWNSLLTPGSNYYWNLSVDGNRVFAQIDPNAVPEPSTWALLILGFVGLMWYRRRK